MIDVTLPIVLSIPRDWYCILHLLALIESLKTVLTLARIRRELMIHDIKFDTWDREAEKEFGQEKIGLMLVVHQQH